MKIVCSSDLHGALPEIPRCDVLLLAGDVTPVNGPAAITPDQFRRDPGLATMLQKEWLRSVFAPWVSSLKVGRVILIAGNHDFCMQSPGWPGLAEEIGVTYLEDSGVKEGEVSFWGTPWVTGLSGWAFTVDESTMGEMLDPVPHDTDILLSHCPPHGLLDNVNHLGGAPLHVGSRALAKRIGFLSPPLMICGHIHEHHGIHRSGSSVIANVALMDGNYDRCSPQSLLEVEFEDGMVRDARWIEAVL